MVAAVMMVATTLNQKVDPLMLLQIKRKSQVEVNPVLHQMMDPLMLLQIKRKEAEREATANFIGKITPAVQAKLA